MRKKQKNAEEPCTISPYNRFEHLRFAHKIGIKTWVSMEPVILPSACLSLLVINPIFVDRYKIGKLNYHPSDIDWADFGRQAEAICKQNGIDYYIKESLRAEMDKGGNKN